MLSRKSFALSLGALCLSLALAVCAWAQTNTSRISGTVTDSSGAVPSLPVGSYTITVEMTGFKTANQAGVIIQVNTPVTADIAMEVGQANEIVNVTGGVERLQTDNATIGNVVQQKAIESLPLNGRNPLTLLTLEPGVRDGRRRAQQRRFDLDRVALRDERIPRDDLRVHAQHRAQLE